MTSFFLCEGRELILVYFDEAMEKLEKGELEFSRDENGALELLRGLFNFTNR